MTVTVYTEKYLHLFKQINLDNTSAEIDVGSLGKIYFISCQIQNENVKMKTTLDELADTLATTVLKAIAIYLSDKYELKICCNIKNYQNKIKNDIRDIVSEGTINIDGYINFRTKEIKKDIEKKVMNYKKELQINKDYLEFIKLMRYYVTTQSCNADVLYINLTESDKYELFDSKKRNITQKMIDIYKRENDVKEIDYNDCLINTLFNLLPKKIIIHDIYERKNIEVLNTINLVFFNRIQIECSI